MAFKVCSLIIENVSKLNQLLKNQITYAHVSPSTMLKYHTTADVLNIVKLEH